MVIIYCFFLKICGCYVDSYFVNKCLAGSLSSAWDVEISLLTQNNAKKLLASASPNVN